MLLHKLCFKENELDDMKLDLLVELDRLVDDSVDRSAWSLLLWPVEEELCQEPNCVVLKDELGAVNKLAAYMCMLTRYTLFRLSLLSARYEVLAH